MEETLSEIARGFHRLIRTARLKRQRLGWRTGKRLLTYAQERQRDYLCYRAWTSSYRRVT